MDIYLKKRRWKILLFLAAIIIGIASLKYTNWLTDKLSQEERKKVELWAEAIKRLASDEITTETDISLIEMISNQNTSIPLIVTNADDSIMIHANISFTPARQNEILTRELKKMKAQNPPIEIFISENIKQFLYYRESYLLRNLRLFPIVQLLVIFLFIGVAYLAFSASRSAEQNQVWVGMSKETAHQLGTPISSLMAWVELLRLQKNDPAIVGELENDIQRLEKITERFSKIGSKPELLHTDMETVIRSTLEYLKRRSSGKIKYEFHTDGTNKWEVPLNEALFSWVIENLCKNAMDAMNGEGTITISLKEKENNVIVDLSDTGKGLHKSQFKTIFQPGYSTKKRGWGLGLSLAKRIVENYHKGKIFIKESEINKGTTFRILLKKNA
ncbi:MAG TPA: HAMP domain-containing sensor histidine kinase [Prolixibacteraceae bacterium]|nr:HAMP domain-containing histidine kinase [Prolixibacteraceae bacterium]HOF54284.1 HAMP domain-containing sensor histidine kinase [Prolixibacteraceae bacterium]HOR99104.1 HAMP domain-containing sensor histidine kinase [Prolixibacteraceae bacterium]HOS90298.1 HAMP domain-containing sensor histidine kinase [Prolixibacteraceae bacterium]HPL44020.1 HAMP domain-containing sensor histidine kinase [Prolixibacteraceae bacterium]